MIDQEWYDLNCDKPGYMCLLADWMKYGNPEQYDPPSIPQLEAAPEITGQKDNLPSDRASDYGSGEGSDDE